MAYSLKKVLAAMAVSLVAATSVVSASIVDGGYMYDGSYGPGPGNGCCPPPCNPCGPAYSCGPCGDFYFSAEALIFRACEDGLAYGTFTETFTPPTTATATEIDSRVKNVHPNWNVGFRLGVGYSLPCDCWGIAVNWTHFDSHTHHTFEESFVVPGVTGLVGGRFLTPAYGRVDFNTDVDLDGIDSTEARWKLHLDLVDVELGRPVCISQCLTLRPHIGIRAAWIKQSYDIEYHAISDAAVETLLSEVDLKCDYEGVGLRGGLDTIWDLGCGISLYGSAAASVLWGHFNVKSETFYTFPVGTAFFDVEQKDDFCACRAATDAAIGLRWRSCFCGDSMALTLNVGWEHHLFFNQNQFEDFVVLDGDATFEPTIGEVKNPQYHRGNLCLSGVVIGARLDF